MSTGGSWPGISSDVNPCLLNLVAGNRDLAKPTESNRRVSDIGTPKPAAITDKRVPSSFPTQGREVKVNKRINWLKKMRAKRFVAAMIGACAMKFARLQWKNFHFENIMENSSKSGQLAPREVGPFSSGNSIRARILIRIQISLAELKG